MRVAPFGRSMSKSAIACCLANGPVTEVLIDGEDRLIMKESDVFGVIEEDALSSAKAA